MAANSYSDYGLQPNGETILGAADGSPITLPSESLLLGGDYARAGSDLLISHADHGQVRIPDYFSHDDLPVLRLDNGALLTGDTVASLAGPLAPGQYAQAGGGSAGTPIGTVDTAGGTVTATRTDGTTVTLSDGDPVFQGDVVQTGTGSNLSIIFIDDTVFTLSADARMVLDELVYSPGGSDNSMVMNLVQGTFIFVTGQVAPNGDMRVETPTATMGIRGTTPVVTIDAGGAGKYSLARDPNGDIGSYQIFDKVSGALIGTINTVTEFVEIAAVGSPPIILPKTQADQSSEESQLQQAYSSSRQATGDQGNQNNGGENNNNPGGNEPNQTDAGGSESLGGPPAGGGTPGGGPGQPGANPETGTGEGLNLLNPGTPPPAPTSPPANPNPPANEQTTEPEQLGLDVPSITIETNEDEAITISGLQVDVPGGGDVQVQITASSTVTLASLSGLTFEAGDGTGDEFLIFTGSQSAVNAALNGLEYTPTPDSETGGLIFELTAGGETVTVDVPIEITPQPDAPIANAVSLNVDEGETVNGAFSVTDPDVGDTVTLNSFTFLSPDLGDLTIFIDGTFTFVAGSDFESLSQGDQVDVTFQYTAIDSTGLISDPALVTFTVDGVNQAPTMDDSALAAVEDGPPVTLDLSQFGDDSDSEDDGSSLTYTITNGPGQEQGSASISGTTLSFDPGNDFQDLGVGDTRKLEIEVTATDKQGATTTSSVEVTVSGNEDAPVITGTTSGSVTEDSVYTATGALMATDADAADTPTFTAQADTAGTYGTFSLTAAGNWTYTLDNDAAQSLGDNDSITETFTAVATTADGESVSQDVTVTVNGADEPVTEVQEGFENDFSETWVYRGASIVSPEDPTEGSHVLLLDTNAEDVAPVSTAAAILGTTVGDLNALGNAIYILEGGFTELGETTEGSVLSSTEYIEGSGTIEFDYRFTTDDYLPFNDFAVFSFNGNLYELADVATTDTDGLEGGLIDTTGWLTYDFDVEAEGFYSIGFGVFDVGDTAKFSTLEIDNIRFTPDNLDPPEVFLSELSIDVEPLGTHPGDTVYGFNSTEPGTEFDFASNQNPDVVIEDTSGNDTLDLSGYVTASAIDLTPGAFSSANGQTDNIQIALGTDIENAIGGAGDDTLRGNDLANRLDGGVGLDTLTGGGGADVFVLSHTDAADIITDFDLSADRLDISALLDANFTPGELSNYIDAETNPAGDISVSVDQDGAGTAHGYEEVAILQGASSGGVIDFVFQDNGVQVTETFAA